MTAVRFHRDGGNYTVHFHYDPGLVDLMKTVPSHGRSWNATAKEWRVTAVYAGQLARSMRECGYVVTGMAAPPPRGAHRGAHRRTGEADWAQSLFQRVGDHRVDLVFRALTKVLHPDNLATGDSEIQRELNVARDIQRGTPLTLADLLDDTTNKKRYRTS